MARAHYRDSLLGTGPGNGAVVLAGASVTVRTPGTSAPTPTTLYAADTGAATLSNPITADASGTVEFWTAEDASFDLYVEAGGFAARTIRVATRAEDTVTAATLVNPTLSGTVTGTPAWNSPQAMSVTGNAATASTAASATTAATATTATTAGSAAQLTTPRTINGVSFDGTANVTVPAAAGTLSGTTLAASVVTSSLQALGTLSALTTGAGAVATFGGRVLQKKGADVASANDITLGAGNLFRVTGTTQIQRIATAGWQEGSQVVLRFAAALTVKSGIAAGGGFAGIVLLNNSDFVGYAGAVLELAYEGGEWVELTRNAATPADTTAPTLSSIGGSSTTPAIAPTGQVFYVSQGVATSGSGASWASAWKELNNIDWTQVDPGDTIVIDGGPTGGSMVYNTQLNCTKSGTSANPIKIMVSQAAGRNGQAIFHGGRTTLLPYWGESGYTGGTGTLTYAINIASGVTDLVIEGSRWNGLLVRGCNNAGININGATCTRLRFRNIEVYDNGQVLQSAGAASQIPAAGLWYSDKPGIYPRGSYLYFDYCSIHDNGEDAFQNTGGNVNNVFLYRCWVYNSRVKPAGSADPGSIFNNERHPDGVQFYGGTMSNLRIDSTIFGPYILQALAMGNSTTAYNNVTVIDTLSYGITGHFVADNGGSVGVTGWSLTNVTSVMPTIATGGQVSLTAVAGQIPVTDSVFEGGDFWYSGASAYSGNHVYNLPPLPPAGLTGTQGPTRTATAPGFVTAGVAQSLSTTADFTLSGSGAAVTKGTRGPKSSTALAALSPTGTVSVTITWTTNEASDSQVEYGLTGAYGTSTTLETALTTSHSVTITGLAPGTLYYYRVKSRDAAGNLATSAQQTLTTAGA
jgi:hypothetical protein